MLLPPKAFTYLDAVARAGSIRKAAERLNVVSSAISRDLGDRYGEDYRVIGVTSGAEALDVLSFELRAVDGGVLPADDDPVPAGAADGTERTGEPA